VNVQLDQDMDQWRVVVVCTKMHSFPQVILCSIHASFGEDICLLAQNLLKFNGWYDFIDAVSTADIIECPVK
jgi:hypothetical protein